jgi:hypothetical protein
MEADVTYFNRRAAEERAAAMASADLRVRQVHLDMAERYQDLANGIAARNHFLALDLYGAA